MKNILIVLVMAAGIFCANAQENTKDIFIKDGDLIKATLFHDNGEISQTGFYTKQGKLQGTWMSYDLKGNKTAEAHYDNGSKTGKWFFWQEDNILKEVDYSNSKIAAVNTWKIQGERVVSAN